MTVYFFCHAGVKNCNTACGVLRGLVWHLMVQFSDTAQYSRLVLETLQAKHRALDMASLEHMKTVLSSRETLWLTFVKLLEEKRRGPIFCILDDSDECDEDARNWLVTKLLSLKNDGGKNGVKLLLTSREVINLVNCEQANRI
jgi:hypothetical protein